MDYDDRTLATHETSAPSARKLNHNDSAHFDASRRCNVGWVLHASSAGFSAASDEGALSIKTMTGGRARYTLGRARLAVDGAAYAILNRGRPYEVDVAPGVESFCLFFRPDAVRGAWLAATRSDRQLLDLPDSSPPPEFFERRYDPDDSLMPLLSWYRTLNLSDPSTPELWDDRLLTVLHRMFKLHQRIRLEVEQVDAVRPSTRDELYRRLHRARDFIEASLQEALDLERVADVANLSPFHLHRTFKTLFDLTPARYVRKRRLELAKELLRNTDLPVLDVCRDVGYQSLGSFTTLFQRHTGTTPAAFRRESLGG